MSIKKKIRNNISLLKEEKTKTLVESNLTKGRFSVINSNINLNSKIKSNQFFNSIFEEVRFLNNTGVKTNIIKENLITVLNNLSDDDLKVNDKFKDRLLEYLSNKLNVVGFEKEVLEMSILDTDDDDIPKLFTDSRFLSRKMADIFVNEFERGYLTDLTNTTKEIIMDQLDIKKLKGEIEDRYADILDTLMGSIRSEMEQKLSDIRDNVFS